MLEQFQTILKDQNLASSLKKGSENTSAIKVLQQSLYDLGFSTLLKWQEFGADGDFGDLTSSALQEFARLNGVSFDGTQVSPELSQKIAEKYEIAQALRALKDVMDLNEVESTLKQKSDDLGAVKSLQIILFKLGFGMELKWEKYGADGGYGGASTAAVKAFAAKENLTSDGTFVSKELLQKILDKFRPQLGPDWGKSADTSHARIALPPSIKRHRNGKGVYDAGRLDAKTFIEKNPDILKEVGMTPSTMKVIAAVSENEGKLEAINTYDNSFMTFGMFQWTIGAADGLGELAALLKKVKLQDAHVFHKYFGQYGLDVDPKKTGRVYGLLTLNGRALNKPKRKERLRTHTWAVRFWKAGHDPLIQAIEIEHAANRLKSFYWHESFRTQGHLLSELVTSEYGVALILDNHVNRPAWVDNCIGKAMEETGLSSSSPKAWTTADEAKLLAAYLRIRTTYKAGKASPMTHAEKRGKVVKGLNLSEERGSFKFEVSRSRSRSTVAQASLPRGYSSDDYEVIEMPEEE